MHKSFKKDAKRRFADVVQDIIKMTSKEEIIMFIQSQALNLDPQFKDQNLIQQINDYELQMLQTPIIAGKDKGKPIISVIKLEQHYKGFKATLAKNLKLKRKMDKKSLDALFTIHLHDIAIIASGNKKLRKLMNIKGGIFG
tara:strand:- start:614 stop:1036 length:423 start_codon:yes stop_codon:yes gene_type:complete